MILDLKRVFCGDCASLPVDYSFDMSDVEFSGSCPLKAPVKITGVVTDRSGLVELTSEIEYVYSAPCDRCGVPSEHRHSVKSVKALASSVEGEENDEILLVPDMKLDLDKFIYTEVITNMPMKHLCGDGCKGICCECGQNLNDGECNCTEKKIDPRLSALAELLK